MNDQHQRHWDDVRRSRICRALTDWLYTVPIEEVEETQPTMVALPQEGEYAMRYTFCYPNLDQKVVLTIETDAPPAAVVQALVAATLQRIFPSN